MGISDRPAARLAAFAVGLVLVFGAGLGLGSLTAADEPAEGPPATSTDQPDRPDHRHDEGALR